MTIEISSRKTKQGFEIVFSLGATKDWHGMEITLSVPHAKAFLAKLQAVLKEIE